MSRLGRSRGPPGAVAPDLIVGGRGGVPGAVLDHDDRILAAARGPEPGPGLPEHLVVPWAGAEPVPAPVERLGKGRGVGQGADGLHRLRPAQRLVMDGHRRPQAVAQQDHPAKAELVSEGEGAVEIGRRALEQATAVDDPEVRHAGVDRQRGEAGSGQLDRGPPRDARHVVAHGAMDHKHEDLPPLGGASRRARQQGVPGVPVGRAVGVMGDGRAGVVDAEGRAGAKARPEREPPRSRGRSEGTAWRALRHLTTIGDLREPATRRPSTT